VERALLKGHAPAFETTGHMTTRRVRLFFTILCAAIITVLLSTATPRPISAQTTDPCTTGASLTSAAAPHEVATEPNGGQKRKALDHDDRWRHLDAIWTHRAGAARRRASTASTTAATAAPMEVRQGDIGDVAVLQDAGDMMTVANPLDLADAALRFTPNGLGGYDVGRITYGFRQPLGSSLTLGDDDTHEVALPFGFRYYGQSYDRVFINSDGNLTFTAGDASSTERSVSRFLSGPPRVAVFFADLDSSTSGRVLTSSNGDAFTVTWCGVREYGTPVTTTAQVTLLSDGAIEMQLSARTTIRTAVVGISPGATSEFTAADLSVDLPLGVGVAAVGERFTTLSDLDTVAVARRFLATHADEFDNLVIFTDTPLFTDGFAYQLSISNAIQGLNLPLFDYSTDYGTAGRLQSLCNMDALTKYPDEPREKFLGENSTVSVLGQEFGHRWLAFLEFRDHNSRQSRALLGRDSAHWSFFFDSDGSVLEGNDIVETGTGSFRTVAAVQRYSLLDQYAMGLVDQSQVPPFWYVQSPTNVSPRRTSTSAPEVGVTFDGTRRQVRIEDVIAITGPRVPSGADSPRVYRQAFVYVTSPGRSVEVAEIEKVDRIRSAWDQFLSAATDSRMRVDTRLALPPDSEEAQARARRSAMPGAGS
jgi:hypothetical protein